MKLLSYLVITPATDARLADVHSTLYTQTREAFDAMVALAHSNHVVVRGLEVYRDLMTAAGDAVRAEWASTVVTEERARIAKAIGSLRLIVDAFDQGGLDVTVMKSLDHWPDFGSDIDLYSNATPEAVAGLMKTRFNAEIEPRSWGDRLAGKWNFAIPDLAEAVEVHAQRLGQTGEQLVLATRLPGRSRALSFDGQTFRVPAASDRLMISTLQRMYRHFYFRLCDIIDSAGLVTSGQVDFDDLRASATTAGIWEGVATYLMIVSDYVVSYGGAPLPLPQFVKESAQFPGSVVFVGGPFIRVPIMPQAAGLYRKQFAGLVSRGELGSTARLAMLPPLATAAAIGHKLTGSDKGIW